MDSRQQHQEGRVMPVESIHGPLQNRILAALSPSGYAHLRDDFEVVSLAHGQVLYEAGALLEYVYFPLTCIVSLVSATRNGSSAELAMTGNDGLVGIQLALGDDRVADSVIVQAAGTACRIKSEVMRWELDQDSDLRHLTLRYIEALMMQMTQSVVCNRHHAVEQRLCRWLLMSLDLLPGKRIDITQETMADMLGVRRESITEAAGKLQSAGLLHYSRGHIEIIDRPGLETRACECYAVVKLEYDRLFQPAAEARAINRIRGNPATLRKRAMARLLQTPPAASNSPCDNGKLLHELQVHQVELEMQIEELNHAYEEADALRSNYADIYDFAPVAYFTLDASGYVLDLNLAGAILLGIKRSQKSRHRFMAYITAETLPVFNHFIGEVLLAKDKKACEIVLAATRTRCATLVRVEAVTDEGGQECRMVVMNVTGGG
jgi:CRP-like cAMP-binding protein